MSKILSRVFLACAVIAALSPCAMSDSMSNKPGTGGGGGGTPGGSNTQIQYNNAGSFGGLTNTQVATRVGPQNIVVTGDYTVVSGGNQLLTVNAAAPVTITLPVSTLSTGTTVTVLNQVSDGTSPVTVTITAPDNAGGDTIQPQGIRTFVPYNDGTSGDVGWAETNIYYDVLTPNRGGTGIQQSGTDATLALKSDGANGFVMGAAGGLPETPLSVPHGGTGATTLTGAVVGNGTSAMTAGTLTVPNGGTGATTLTANGVLLGHGTSAVTATAAGTAGQPLVSGGAGVNPGYATLGVSGGGTGATTLTGALVGNGTSALTAGTLSVPNGGSGATTLTGVVLGNGASAMTALTDTQLTTHINAFTTALSGAAPASGGGTTNFLRADGTWAAAGGASSPLVLQSTANAQIPLTIKGVTSTQSGHLLEWYYQDNSTLTGYVSADGLTLHSYTFDSQTGVTAIGDVSIGGAFITSGVGKTLNLKIGANGATGTGTLSGGTVTISNTSVTANSKIFLTSDGGGTIANMGTLYMGTITAGTGFVVNSSNASDNNNFHYIIINTF